MISPESSKENPKHKNLNDYLKNRGIIDKIKDKAYNTVKEFFNKESRKYDESFEENIRQSDRETTDLVVGRRRYIKKDGRKKLIKDATKELENNSSSFSLPKNEKLSQNKLGSLLPENISSYQNKVNELQNKIESSKIELSDDEQYAINQYIGPESYKINEILRNNLELTKQQEKIINNLDKVLDKMPNYNGIVQRSLMLDKNQLKIFFKLHQEGNIIKYKAYTSATVGNRYNNFSNVELLIKSINGKDIRKYNKEEQEILFKRNTKFKVIRKEKIKDIYYIQMEEINE